MEYSEKELALEALAKLKSKILKCVDCSICDFICVGGNLDDLKRNEFFKYEENPATGKSYKNIYEYVKTTFNMSKSSCASYIAVCLRFGNLKTSLKPEYKDYSFAQLVEMLSLNDEQIKLVNPSMTIAEIRAIRRVVQTSGQNETETNEEVNHIPNIKVKTSYLINFDTKTFDKLREHLKKFKGGLSIDDFVNEAIKEKLKKLKNQKQVNGGKKKK